VLPLPIRLLSDAHIGACPPAAEASLLAHLRALRGAPGSLVLNGDILDFWFEWRRSVPSFALPVLGALAELRASGMPILWLAGNHDCWGGSVLRREVGVEYVEGPVRMPAGAWDLEVVHGDGLRGDADRRYRAMKRVLRHRWSSAAFSLLHPDLGTRLALGTSSVSRNTQHAVDEGAGLRDAAFARLAAPDGPTLVVYGHSHVPGIDRAPGGGVYANPGAWAEAPRWLEIEATRVVLRERRASGEVHDLDVAERGAEKALPDPQHGLGGIGGDDAVPRGDVPRRE
jgi:UDP-2,3-diacylglucosamine hydrolase